AIEAIYRERLIDIVSLRECAPKKPPASSQSGWRKLRQASMAALSELSDEGLEDRTTHEDRTAAGQTANHYKATAKAFINWVLRESRDFRLATEGRNAASLIPDYTTKHTGEEF